MSGGRPLPSFVNPITPETYQANKASLEAAQARIAELEAINEEGRMNHAKLERALQEKIREGELARQMLDRLKDPTQAFSLSEIPITRQILPPPLPAVNSNSINVASTSRVEDARDHYPPYSNSSQQNPVSTPNGYLHPSQTFQPQKQAVQELSLQPHHQGVEHQMQHNQTALPTQDSRTGRDVHVTHQMQPRHQEFRSDQRIPHGQGRRVYPDRSMHGHTLQQQQWQPAGQVPPQPNFSPETSSLSGALGPSQSAQTNTQGVTNIIHLKQPPLPSSSLQPSDNSIPPRSTASSLPNAQTGGLSAPLPQAPQTSSRPQEVVQSSGTVPAVNGHDYYRSQRPGAEHTILYLKHVIADWDKMAPPHSYFDLPYTNYRVYKNKASEVNIIIPDGKGNTLMVRPASLSVSHLSQLQPSRPNITTTTKDLTSAPNPSSHNPTPATTSANATVLPPPLNPTTVPSKVLPSPAQADKKHLARDILRALAPAKRPRDGEGPRVIDEPDAKRHAAGQKTLPTSRPFVMYIPKQSNNSISQHGTSITPYGATTKITDPKYDSASSKEFIRFIPTAVSMPTQPPSTTHAGPLYSTKVTLVGSGQTAQTASIIEPISDPPVPDNAVMRTSMEVDQSSAVELSSDNTQPAEPSPTPPPPTPVVASPTTEKLPLFLPSPASTQYSGGDRGPGDDLESASMSVPVLSQTSSLEPLGQGKRWLMDYVDVPPLPDYVLKFKAQFAKGKQKGSSSSETTSNRISSRSASSFGEDIEFTLDSQGTFTIDPVEKNAVRLSCTRLRKIECEWAGCDVVLNSVQGLLAHLNSTHKPSDRKPFMCLWKQCGRRCTYSEKHPSHLETHALLPLHCAYEDCEEFFRSPGRLVKHNLSEHQEDNLKPSASPFRPGPEPLPPTPPKLPSYMVEARSVKPASISQTRHSDLGPWVLRHIAGPVFVTERTNAATPLKSHRASKKTRVEKMDSIYSFLTPELKMIQHSSRVSHGEGRFVFKDLESCRVSELLSEGMVLWGTPEGELDSPQRTPSSSQHLDRELFKALSLGGTIKLEGDAGLRGVTPPPGEPNRREDSSDEDAVGDILAYTNSL